MKILKTLAFTAVALATTLSVITSVNAQQREALDVAYLYSRTEMGCYNPVVLACGLGLGDRLVCNFTGSYGAPYNCTEYSCYGGETDRHCVQPQ